MHLLFILTLCFHCSSEICQSKDLYIFCRKVFIRQKNINLFYGFVVLFDAFYCSLIMVHNHALSVYKVYDTFNIVYFAESHSNQIFSIKQNLQKHMQ